MSELTEKERAKKEAAALKRAKTARIKKLQKQLNGLELAEKFVRDLLKTGMGTVSTSSIKTYETLSKQLGNHYLPGAQRLVNMFVKEMKTFLRDKKEDHLEAAVGILEKLWSLLKKSKVYLTEKLEKEEDEPDNTELYEEMGGIWKLSELEAIGNLKQDAQMVQLGFWVYLDESRQEYIDTGCWMDLENGQISLTKNYRPLSALNHIEEDKPIDGVALLPKVMFYPGRGNQRIRWKECEIRPYEETDIAKVNSYAQETLKAAAQEAKNILKDALADSVYFGLLSYESIEKSDNQYVLRNKSGETIVLEDSPYLTPATEELKNLPQGDYLHNQVLLGAFFYDSNEKRIKFHPVSIVMEKAIVRLLY